MSNLTGCKKCDGSGCHWCVLPDSLKPADKRKRRPCESCGALTSGTLATLQRLMPDGSLLPTQHLCGECDPHSAQWKKRHAALREQRDESRKAGYGRRRS